MGELTKNTIGLKGVPGLWIFSNLYKKRDLPSRDPQALVQSFWDAACPSPKCLAEWS